MSKRTLTVAVAALLTAFMAVRAYQTAGWGENCPAPSPRSIVQLFAPCLAEVRESVGTGKSAGGVESLTAEGRTIGKPAHSLY